ncbi:MAG: hypothetical protein K6F32_01900, partial [Bacilli bacterium]|nr:hypothetical protein [Bacilli bacterium]
RTFKTILAVFAFIFTRKGHWQREADKMSKNMPTTYASGSVSSNGQPVVVLAGQPQPTIDPKKAVNKRKQEVVGRFPSLTERDQEHPGFEAITSTSGLTLRSLMEGFRSFAAGSRGLYYSRSDIASFLASMAASRTIILQGMSGTGKTSLPVAWGVYLGSTTDVVPVQPTWKERADVLGYYNEFTGRYSESQLLKSLYAASGTDAMKIVVLDEANIARVEYYFAEFLSLLELPDSASRRLPVAPSGMEGDPDRMEGGAIPLPDNVWFVMTANNDDSTFAFSDKVYDRASVIDLDTRAEPFAAEPGHGVNLSQPEFARLCREAEARYAVSARDMRRIASLDAFLRDVFGVSFGNRVMAQMAKYVAVYSACGLPAQEALDQILARKVLRKLGAANPALVRARSGELVSLMASLFGEGAMPLCERAIMRISANG